MRGSTAGLADSLKGKSHTHYALLTVLDYVFASLVVAPAVVGYYRSTWNLTKIYLYPDNPIYSELCCLLLGFIGNLVFGIAQHALTGMFHPDKHRIMYYTMSRVYTACYAFTCVSSWRGAWDLLDRYTGGETFTVMATTLVSVLSLGLMRGIRNLAAAPFALNMDLVDGYFEVPTMFKTFLRVAPSHDIVMRGSTAGLADSLKGKSHTHYALLAVLDTVFSSLVVAPAVVGYWRSTWNLTKIYIYPEDPIHSELCCLLLGFIGHLVFGIAQHALAGIFHPDKHRIMYYTMSRVYTACFAFTCVSSWRGAWDLLDRYTGDETFTVMATTLVSVLSLGIMRGLRNLSAAPFALSMDLVNGYFEVPTMFKASSDKTSLYILDCIFSVFVIGSLVVFVWRGAWVLFDIFLFPEDFTWSSWVSLILGYAMVAMAFSMQPAMRWLCDRLTGFARIFVADVFLFFSVIGTINVWRGIWNLLDIYFLPEYPEISCWTTHWVSLLLLILLNCSNSLLVRGVYIDAEEAGGKCVVFPIYYLRLIFKNERQKKHIKNIQLEVMAKRKHDIDCLKPKNGSCTCHPEQNHVLLLQQTLEPNHIEV